LGNQELEEQMANGPTSKPVQEAASALKSWVMIALTFVFVLLYAAALMGWLTQIENERMVSRLEPIIFVIIGYYFGRLPSQQNESSLKEEILRQSQLADAAQHARELAQQSREALEEKVKNVATALSSGAPGVAVKHLAESLDSHGGALKEDALRQSIAVALNILNS
jgi:hypothetical protein